MRTHTGVATAMFEALADAGVNIEMITTSEIKISVLVDRAAAVAALRTVHRAFLLDERIGEASIPSAGTTQPPRLKRVRATARGPSRRVRRASPATVALAPSQRHGHARATPPLAKP